MNLEQLQKLLAQQEAIEEKDQELIDSLKAQIEALENPTGDKDPVDETPPAPQVDPKVAVLERQAKKAQEELQKLQEELKGASQVTKAQEAQLAKLEAKAEERYRQSLIAQAGVPEELLDILPESNEKLESFLKGPGYSKMVKALAAESSIQPPTDPTPKGPRTPAPKSSTPKAKRGWNDIKTEDLTAFDGLFDDLD